MRLAFWNCICLSLVALNYGFMDPIGILDRHAREENAMSPLINWWWNVKSSGQEDVSGQRIHSLDKDTMTKIKDGGYRYWWWQNIMVKFPNGTIVARPDRVTRPPPRTVTTTDVPTTTESPTTTTSRYPAWPTTCRRTDRDSLGPFYWPFVPFPPRDTICPPRTISGSRLDVTGYVFTRSSQDCSSLVPEANAKVEIWMAGINGDYSSACTGYVLTDDRGLFSFVSVQPVEYGGRPRHIHYQITTQRGVRFVTQMYFESNNHRGRDPDLTVNDTLIQRGRRVAHFNVIL